MSILCLGFALVWQFSWIFELEEEFCKGYAPQLNFHFDNVREETRWFDMFWDYEIVHRHNSKENNNIPRDKSRCNAPPDWLKATIARIVPSLQLAQTEPLLHLTPYSYTFRARSRIFSHTPFFARHYSLPPRQPSVFGSLAIINTVNTYSVQREFDHGHCLTHNFFMDLASVRMFFSGYGHECYKLNIIINIYFLQIYAEKVFIDMDTNEGKNIALF